MAYNMLTVRRRRLDVVNLETITTHWGSLFHEAITRTGKEFARTLIRELEMWVNAQRDGRPAEYRWRPLFNAAKFG